MAELEFEVVDVFTDTAFAGNPLAVVLGGDALTTAQMHQVAREFNLSETTFPLRPTAQEAARGVDYRLRIFTPATEMPFAGHPSVGTAWLLAQRGDVLPGRVVQTCGAGDLPLAVPAGGGPVQLTGGTPSLDAGGRVDVDLATAGAGLVAADVNGFPVVTAGTGIDFAYLFVAPDAVARAVPDTAALHRLVAGTQLSGLYVVGWPAAAGEPVRARMFAPDLGVLEDAATGSAALGLAVAAVHHGLLAADGTSSAVVRQGVEMGRPSTLHLEVDAEAGAAVEARVSGGVVRVSRGWVTVPA